ncbi:MAG: hypothetical protein ACTSWZ_06835, partial [Candidatus Heimdallarchaeaceae archaeon]
MDVTKSTGNGVPDHTERKRAIIKNKAAKNRRLPISDLTLSFIYIPSCLPLFTLYCMYITVYYFY